MSLIYAQITALLLVHKPRLHPILWVQVAEQTKKCRGSQRFEVLLHTRVIIVSLSLT